MVSVQINNEMIKVPEGTRILEATNQVGIKIPTLCYVEGMPPKGACRLCLVEIENSKTLAAACSTPVTKDMKIFTNTNRVRDARRLVVELLLSEHNGDCKTCERSNDCKLQELACEMGITQIRYEGEKQPGALMTLLPH